MFSLFDLFDVLEPFRAGAEALQRVCTDWILASGEWDDTGCWDDTAIWNDTCPWLLACGVWNDAGLWDDTQTWRDA